MEVFEAIRTVLAVRAYRPDPLPEELIERIVGAGGLTASSMNRQPWHFVVVDDKATLGQLAVLAKTGPYIAEAPLALVVAVEKGSPFGVSDGSPAVQSVVLAAWGEGLGPHLVGLRGEGGGAPVLGIPAGYEIPDVVRAG